MIKTMLFGWKLRCRYHLECPIPMDYIRDFLNGDMSHICQSKTLEIIRTSKSSRIVRLWLNQKSVILKIFHRHKFKDKLRGRPTGPTEYRNLIEAAKRNIRTPKCYMYFEKKYCGFLKYSGIVMEDIRDYTEFSKLYANGQSTYFDVIPLLNELYVHGVNHSDFSPRNVFLNVRNKGFTVIDWQYCSFYPKTSSVSLCMMAATFLRYMGVYADTGIWRQWLDELREQCGPDISADKLYDAVRIMQNKKLHWKSRLGLDICGLGLESVWQETN